MRKLIIATTALAFLSSAFLAPAVWSPAFAQSTAAPAAGDTMSKGDAKTTKTAKKSKKSSKMKSDDATKQ
jgi:hypothetical protein